MKRKGLVKAVAGLTAAFALAAGAEWNGYNLFDSKSGGNIVCTIDPTCRALTDGEIEMARDVFGEAIDYRRVKLFHRNYMLVLDQRSNAMTPNGNVYFPKGVSWSNDYSRENNQDRKFLMHELAHVWHYQTGKTMPREALDNYVAYDFNYEASYDYSLKDYALFSDYNIEQQASMIGDYAERRYDLSDRLDIQMLNGAAETDAMRAYKAENCPVIKALEAKIGQVLPLQRETACPEQAARPPRKRHRSPARRPSSP